METEMTVKFNINEINIIGWLTKRDLLLQIDDFDFNYMIRKRRHDWYHFLENDDIYLTSEWQGPRVSYEVLEGFLRALPESVLPQKDTV